MIATCNELLVTSLVSVEGYHANQEFLLGGHHQSPPSPISQPLNMKSMSLYIGWLVQVQLSINQLALNLKFE